MRTDALHEADSVPCGLPRVPPRAGRSEPRAGWPWTQPAIAPPGAQPGEPLGRMPGQPASGPRGAAMPSQSTAALLTAAAPASVGPGLRVGEEPRRWCLGPGCP